MQPPKPGLIKLTSLAPKAAAPKPKRNTGNNLGKFLHPKRST